MSAVDSGWCWVIAIACCWISFVVQGLVRCGGIIYVAFIDTFHITRQEASWPFTLRIAIWNMTGPVAGLLSYYWSIRTITLCGAVITFLGSFFCYVVKEFIYITIFFGVVQGIGTGFLITLLPVIINQYFVLHKATALGIACAGATIGSFAMPPLVNFLLNEYNLYGTLLLTSGIILNSVVGACLLRPANKKRTQNREISKLVDTSTEDESLAKQNENATLLKDSTKDSSEVSHGHFRMTIKVLINPMFLLISLNYVIFFLCYMTYLMVIVDFAIDSKIEESDAIFLVSAFSIADMTGRLGSGWVTDRGFVRRRHLLMTSMIIICVLLSATPLTRNYTQLCVLATFYGFLVGSTIIVFFALLEEYIGLERLPIAVGFMTFLNGCGSFITPVLTGHFRDKTGNYDFLFYALSFSSLLCGFLWIIHCIHLTVKQKQEYAVQENDKV